MRHSRVEGTDQGNSDYAAYDLGQAVAHLTIQAQAMGLHTRQFAAFDHAAVANEFSMPQHWAVTTMIAVGVVPDGLAPSAAQLPSGELVPRERKQIADIVFPWP